MGMKSVKVAHVVLSDGLDRMMLHVGQMLHQPLTRFKSFVETGSPETETK